MMDLLAALRADPALAERLQTACDVEILPSLCAPDDEDGHLTWSIPGQAFARNGSGGEYLLLEDGSVGYHGTEDQGGRLADSLEEFFSLQLHCPFWSDYVMAWKYRVRGSLEQLILLAPSLLEETATDYPGDLREDLRILSQALQIPLADSQKDALRRLWHSAHREPLFLATFRENDGSTHTDSGCIFS